MDIKFFDRDWQEVAAEDAVYATGLEFDEHGNLVRSITFNVVKPDQKAGKFVTIEGRPVFVGGPGQGAGGTAVSTHASRLEGRNAVVENTIWDVMDGRVDDRPLPKNEAERIFWRRSYDLLPEGTQGIITRGKNAESPATIIKGTERWQTSRASGEMKVNLVEYEVTDQRGRVSTIRKNIAAEAFEPLDVALSYRVNAANINDFSIVNQMLRQQLRDRKTLDDLVAVENSDKVFVNSKTKGKFVVVQGEIIPVQEENNAQKLLS